MTVASTSEGGAAQDFTRRCGNCRHRLPRGTCAQPIVAGLLAPAEGFGLVWPPAGYAPWCPAFEPHGAEEAAGGRR